MISRRKAGLASDLPGFPAGFSVGSTFVQHQLPNVGVQAVVKRDVSLPAVARRLVSDRVSNLGTIPPASSFTGAEQPARLTDSGNRFK